MSVTLVECVEKGRHPFISGIIFTTQGAANTALRTLTVVDWSDVCEDACGFGKSEAKSVGHETHEVIGSMQATLRRSAFDLGCGSRSSPLAKQVVASQSGSDKATASVGITRERGPGCTAGLDVSTSAGTVLLLGRGGAIILALTATMCAGGGSLVSLLRNATCGKGGCTRRAALRAQVNATVRCLLAEHHRRAHGNHW